MTELLQAVRIEYAEMLRNGPEHSPFRPPIPPWLKTAVEKGVVALSTRGARDYAVIELKVPSQEGTIDVFPGDYLVCAPDGVIWPCKKHVYYMAMNKR